MTKKPVRNLVTDEQIDKALALAAEYEPYWPAAKRVSYREAEDAVQIELTNGVQIAIPRRLLQGLENAHASQLSGIEITHHGGNLHWPAIDVDHYLPGLLNGVFGSRSWMVKIGRAGGRARTAAKTRAARANGRKGGRPKKKVA